MSHSTCIPDPSSEEHMIMFIHNGGFDGDVLIRRLPREGDGSPDSIVAEFTVDFEVLKAFVARYVEHTRIVAIQEASPDEILLGKV